MLKVARMPATPEDDRKWCETMLDYMEQQYKAGFEAGVNASLDAVTKGGAA